MWTLFIVQVCLQEHLGIDYQDNVHVVFKDYLDSMIEPTPFRVVPKKQVILVIC